VAAVLQDSASAGSSDRLLERIARRVTTDARSCRGVSARWTLAATASAVSVVPAFPPRSGVSLGVQLIHSVD
jgi:hypothetical protein